MKFSAILFVFAIIGIVSCTDITPKQEEHPDADAVYLNIKKEYVLQKDGSIDYSYSHLIKFFTYFSFHRQHGESFVVYDPQYQEVDVLKSETRMASGKKVSSPENAYNEVLPRFANNAPPFNHLRELVITHPGLEKGAIVDLSYKVKTKTGYMPFLMENAQLCESAPIQKLVYVVKVPQETELDFLLINSDVEPSIRKAGGFVVYVWTFENLPATTREAQQHYASDMPRLLFSSSADVQGIYDHINNKPELTLLSNEMKDKAKQIASINENDEEIALALQKMVVEDVNRWSIPAKWSLQQLRPIKECWESNGGSSQEKAMLLTALCKEAGLNAETVALLPEYMTKTPAHYSCFSNLLCKINRDNNSLLLSPRALHAQNLSYKYSNRKMLVFGENKLSLVEIPATSTETDDSVNTIQTEGVVVKGDIKFAGNKTIRADINAQLYGAINPYLSLKNKASKAKKFFSNTTDYTIEMLTENKTMIKYSIKDDELKSQGEYLFWELPQIKTGTNNAASTILPSERKTTLKLACLPNERNSYLITIPENYEMLFTNERIEKSNNIGRVVIENIPQADGTIECIRSLKINKIIIKLEEYAEFREIMNIWNNPKYREVVFKAIKN